MAVAAPTDPGCQGRPTVLLTTHGWVAADFDHYRDSDCYPWGQDAPLWAGLPRGLFRFNGYAVPSRTHGGLASQAAVEARLGRSIPDPVNPEDEVYYWDTYPRVFGVRNNSGETVEARFTRTGGCSAFTHQILDGEELSFGPFWGDASHVLVQIVGTTLGAGGAPTVPSGVDVRVTAPTLADPGETFDFSCFQQIALFDETFEGTGYVETWDQGETVTGTAVLDEDAAVPAGAPGWWGATALRINVVASGETAYVEHLALGDLASSWTTFGLYVDAETLTTGQLVSVLQLRQAAGQEILSVTVQQTASDLVVDFQVSAADTPTSYQEIIALDAFYSIEFRWDSSADQWALYLDETEIDSGAIIESPAAYVLDEVQLGAGSLGTQQPADYYVGRFTVSTERRRYLT